MPPASNEEEEDFVVTVTEPDPLESPLYTLQEEFSVYAEKGEVTEGAFVELSKTMKIVHRFIRNLQVDYSMKDARLQMVEKMLELSDQKADLDKAKLENVSLMLSTANQNLTQLREVEKLQEVHLKMLKSKVNESEKTAKQNLTRLKQMEKRIKQLETPDEEEPRKRPRRK